MRKVNKSHIKLETFLQSDNEKGTDSDSEDSNNNEAVIRLKRLSIKEIYNDFRNDYSHKN